MKKDLLKILTLCCLLFGIQNLKAQNQITYGFVQSVNDPLMLTAVAYPNFNSTNITISTALFSFYLPAGTVTDPAIPVLPAFGSFFDSTGTWRIEKITPASYQVFGGNPNDLQGNDVYQCILQNSPSPASLTNGQPLKLFSFRLPSNCVNGIVQMHVNNNSIHQAFLATLGININNQMSISVNDAPSTDLYIGNNPVTDTYDCPLNLGPPVAVNDTTTTLQNTAVVVNVLNNDYAVGTTLDPSSLVVITQPANGVASVNGNGTITYTPNLNFIGLNTFTYRICDNHIPSLCDTATVFVTVTAACTFTPTVNDPADQVVCNGSPTTAVNFTGTPANVTFSWTNSAPSIGLAASGTGNIPSFAAVNAGTAPVVATIIVTPSYITGQLTCQGTPQTFTITVNPTANVAQPANQELCSGTFTNAVTFSTTVPGTTFSWTNTNTGIGLAASGTGNIPSFMTVNNGNANQVATITVTPSYTNAGVTCTGTARIFTITVFPQATVNVGADLAICQNQVASISATLSGGASGGTWTSTGSGTFGNAASASTTYTPSAADYGQTLTLTFTSNDPAGPCPLNSDALLLSVNTLPIVDAGAPAFICQSGTVTLSTLGASIQANGSGVTNGVWTSSGTGTFSPNNTFLGATTYVPSAADIASGHVSLTLSSNDPVGPCGVVSDVVLITIHIPGSLSCNDLIHVSLDGDCEAEISPDDILEGTYNLQFYTVRLYTLQNVPLPGVNVVTAANIGQTLIVRVFDICNNNVCWGHLIVEDKLPPSLTCENFSIPCNTPNVTPNYLFNVLGIAAANPVVTDCQNFTLTYVDLVVSQDCPTGFTKIITRKWTATDASGNTSTCLQTISLIRPTLADVVLPPDYDGIDEQMFSCTDNAYPTPQWIEAQGLQGFPYVFGQTAACNIDFAYEDIVIKVCDGTYKIRREWTVLDWCVGDGFVYNQIIKVVDNEGPAFVCPANTTVSIDPFSCCAFVNLPDAIVEDNCSRINNVSGMVVTFDQYTGEQSGMFTFGGTVSNFPGNNLWDLDTLGAFGWTPCLPIGTQTVTYIAEDDCGNTTSCTFRLTVRDYIPPIAVCDETTTVGIGVDDPFDCYGPAGPLNVPVALTGCENGGVTWVKAKDLGDGSYDYCGNVKYSVRRMAPYSDCIQALNATNGTLPCDDQFQDFPSEFERAITEGDSIKFYCCEVGTTQTVVLRVYQVDVFGNFTIGPDGEPVYNECMIQVEVQDKLKPYCQPPAHVTVACEQFDPSLWLYGKAQVLDNCCLDQTKVYQEQCGLTHSASYTQFDTVCNKGTIIRTFRAFDCHGQTSQCTQRVVVNYNQDYFVKFPNDVIVTVCDGTGNYGEPIYFGEDCELLGATYQDAIFTVVPDACFKIERTWKIINWCTYNSNLPCINVPNPNPAAITNAPANLPGPTVSRCGTLAPWAPTVVKINPTDAVATNFCTFWDANANCYIYKQIIKIIDGVAPTVVGGCPASPDTICDITPNNNQLWNDMHWWDNTNQSHDLCEAPADICVTATDACSGSNINIEYQLFLDLDGDGVMETIINSINTGIAGLGWNAVPFGNANGGAGTIRTFDGRPVNANQKYGFAIQETISGNTKTACVRFNTQQAQNTFVPAELPYGTHKIKWFISDGCGNESVCEYTIIVKDCKAPTVVCHHGLSVNIMPGGMIAMWDTDFLQYTEDNCTQTQYLKTAIRKCGQGTGFPVDANGQPVKSVNFTCDELGEQCVEIWSIDLAGNADYCQTYIDVQDNNSNCGSNKINVSGALKTENTDGVEEAVVTVAGSSSAGTFSFNDASDNAGLFSVLNQVPAGANFTITPAKDDNPLNGVTTYDLVLISKHILGIEPLGSSYKMIAADANKSNSITTFDIVELRKLILGLYLELPNNTSWRFVDKAYTFPNELNPFVETFPENISIAQAQMHQLNQNFVGVKIGDVNGTAVANNLMTSDDRSSGTLIFDVNNRSVKAGEEFEVTFTAAERTQGYQMTLNLKGLEVSDIVGSDNVSANNFGVFLPAEASAKEGALTVSIDGSDVFTVKFRATKSGKLSEMMSVSSRITKAEGYVLEAPAFAEATAGKAGKAEIALRFDGKTIAGVGFELYQNEPNPFVNKTTIGFHLPETAAATLTIYDETGRVVFTQKGDFAKGYNSILLDRALLNTTGVLYYSLETATDAATRKMIQAK